MRLWGKEFTLNPLTLILLLVMAPIYLIGGYLLYSRKTRRVHIKGRTIKAYIADNIFSHALGFMFRDPKYIDKDEGILFKFNSEGPHYFWNLGTYTDLEVISMDTGDKIILKRGDINPKPIKGKRILEIKRD